MPETLIEQNNEKTFDFGSMNLSNSEGMCLGPKLNDGRQTLILIADSQNGMGNWMYHIKDHIRIVILP